VRKTIPEITGRSRNKTVERGQMKTISEMTEQDFETMAKNADRLSDLGLTGYEKNKFEGTKAMQYEMIRKNKKTWDCEKEFFYAKKKLLLKCQKKKGHPGFHETLTFDRTLIEWPPLRTMKDGKKDG